MESVLAFTDTYLPTVNGVAYTISTWRDEWRERGGRMEVVYPRAASYSARPGEHPVPSLAFPFYDGYRVGLPRTPPEVVGADLVHIHTPFSLGIAGIRYAHKADLPVIASYHTPTREYADYLAPHPRVAGVIEHVSERWERWLLNRVDQVVAPSESTRDYIQNDVGVEAPIRVIPNGVDTDRFRPVNPTAFMKRYDLPEGPLVGYTGRHGYEKRLVDLVEAVAGLDVTLVIGGDGPARSELEARADALDVDARFLGFLDREELPSFYSAVDIFGFPSPVETEGLVALEAMACGTPVVGARSGALTVKIDDGVTGYHFRVGDVMDFQAALKRALEDTAALAEGCLDHRSAISVDRTITQLEELYASV